MKQGKTPSHRSTGVDAWRLRRVLGLFAALLCLGLLASCATSGGPRDSQDKYVEVNNQKDAQTLLEEQKQLAITPENVKGNPEFLILDTAAIPYVPEYRIGPGDVLEVVYHIQYEKTPDDYRLEVQDRVSVHLPFSPQFSTSALVRTDGKASLPMLGDVAMAGRTVADVTAELRQLYSKFIKDPNVTLALEEFNVKVDELKKAITTAPRGQSKIAPVTPDGRAAFPIIGNMPCAGLTVKELEKMINDRYSEFVRNLQVTLIINEVHYNRLYIFGEVNTPGVYEMHDRLSLLQALSQAGGFKDSANLSDVLVFRTSGLQRPLVYKINLSNMLDKAYVYRNIFLMPGDTVYVPKSTLDKINDIIAKVFTKGIWAIVPFSTSAGVTYGYTNEVSKPKTLSITPAGPALTIVK